MISRSTCRYLIKFLLVVISTLSILNDVCSIQIEKCEPMTKWNRDFDILSQLQLFDRQTRLLSPRGNFRSGTISLSGPDNPTDTIICLLEPYSLLRTIKQVHRGSLMISKHRCFLIDQEHDLVATRPDSSFLLKKISQSK